MKLRHALPLLFPASLLLAACQHPWYLVESEIRGVTLAEAPPEITSTREFEMKVRPGIAVALSAPDHCADRSDAATTGEAQPAGELLSTTCGVEMAELERSLAGAGFQVISWNVVQQIVVYEQGITPRAAAKSLGARVLFQVNSLERSLVTRGSDVHWERHFFESDSKGVKGPAVAVPEARARALEDGIAARETQVALEDPTVSVTMNATAILVETGESVWFYSWTHSDDFQGASSVDQLFVCNRKNLSRCLPRQPKIAAVARLRRRRERAALARCRTRRSSANPADAAYFRLVREVVANLVGAFRRGS